MATEKRFVLIMILYTSQKSTIDIVFFSFLSHLETRIFGSIFSFEKNLCSIYSIYYITSYHCQCTQDTFDFIQSSVIEGPALGLRFSNKNVSS